MKPLQKLSDTVGRLADRVLAVRRRPRTRTCVKPSTKQNPSTASSLKIEVVRDLCPQPATTAADGATASSFPHFMDLPVEIRLQIWQLASAVGRVVELQWSRLELGFRNRAAPRPPAVLHACREARHEALTVLRPYFTMGGRRRPIYVDPVNDVLFFRLPPGYYAWRWMVEWMQNRNRRQREALFREELRGICRVAFLARDVQYLSSPFWSHPARLLLDVEELMVLWADWSLRSFEGRGFNLIEGVSPCVNHVHTSILQEPKSVQQWEEHFGYRDNWPKKPVVSLRHWCMREEE